MPGADERVEPHLPEDARRRPAQAVDVTQPARAVLQVRLDHARLGTGGRPSCPIGLGQSGEHVPTVAPQPSVHPRPEVGREVRIARDEPALRQRGGGVHPLPRGADRLLHGAHGVAD